MEETQQDINETIKETINEYTTAPIELMNEKVSHSESIGNIAGALAKAQGSMTSVNKGKSGYGYKYADLASVMEIARKPLAENGLSYIQSHILKKGSTPSMIGETLLMHESGEWIKTEMEGIITVMKQLTPIQSQGVTSTYVRRYMLQSILGIASEEDTDGTSKK